MFAIGGTQVGWFLLLIGIVIAVAVTIVKIVDHVTTMRVQVEEAQHEPARLAAEAAVIRAKAELVRAKTARTPLEVVTT